MEANSNPPKRRFQFTLLNLLLLMTTVAFGFGLYRARLSNEILDAKNQEVFALYRTLFDSNKRLRAERGDLTIEDEKKVYAIRVPEVRENVWTYRIYLPEGDNYFLAQITNQLPSEYGALRINGERPPNGSGGGAILVGKSQGSAIGMRPGEYLITYTILQENDQWKYHLQMKSVSGEIRRSLGMGALIPSREDEWPASSDYTRAFMDGVTSQQQETDLDHSMVLLDYRRCGQLDRTIQQDHSPCGAIVWVDRVSNYEE